MTDMPDIEVGRYALRTFRLWGHRLDSLFHDTSWNEGKAIASCFFPVTLMDSSLDHKEVPEERCRCGLYGTLTLDQLVEEYPFRAGQSIAVFAAEGTTYIGSKGLRTAAGRVVAYWTRPNDIYADNVYRDVCPDAIKFDDVHVMLKAYRFPESEVEWPAPEVSLPPSWKELIAMTLSGKLL